MNRTHKLDMTKKDNTRKLVEHIKSHVAEVLSDIYKIEKYNVNKSPLNKSQWIVNIECSHSEREGVMVIFSFTLTDPEINDILGKETVGHLFRTGRWEYDQ